MPLLNRLLLPVLFLGATCFLFQLQEAGAHNEPALKIAFIFAETGVAGPDNLSACDTARRMIKFINEQGGILGMPVHPVFIDNKSTPIGSKAAAEEAVKEKVLAVIGGIWSSHFIQMAPIFQKAKIPAISPASTKPGLTRNKDYIFRVCFTDDFQAKVLARFALEDLGARRAAILTNVNETYCITLGGLFGEQFRKLGGEIVLEGYYKGMSVDFSGLLNRLRPLEAGVIFIPGYSRDAGLLIKQARKMGLNNLFLGGDGWDPRILSYAGEAVNGSYSSTQWHPQVPYEANKVMLNLLQTRFGVLDADNMNVALTYDAIMILCDAIRRAGSADRVKIRDALSATRNFPGAAGVISFDENGDPKDKPVTIVRYENDRMTFHKIVEP